MTHLKCKRIVPLRTAKRTATTAPNVTYHDGPVISNVEVVTIFWGQAWSQQTSLVTSLNSFFRYIASSSLVAMLAEYSTPTQTIGPGSLKKTVAVTASEPGGTTKKVTDAQVQTALQGWIKAGTVPPDDASTLYFVFLPPGVTCEFENSASCVQFCGYHNNAGSIYYALMPYVDCTGCSYDTIADTLTAVASHELCEAITDPSGGTGWYDSGTGEEIGDICVGNTTTLGGYLVQKIWSQTQAACVVAPPAG
jgi:hypothetical protein